MTQFEFEWLASMYNAAAETKILNVVEQIHQLGNFEIDIVAGALPKQMTITVEGIGQVTQPWTSLGAVTPPPLKTGSFFYMPIQD